MGKWANFDSEQLRSITEALPPFGEKAEALPCPSCGQAALRWYSYRNPFRARSKISYVWCSACRHYYGTTTALQDWDLPDPLDGSSADDRARMEGDLEAFFSMLDGLWQAGELPQVRKRRQGGLRSLRRQE